MSGQRRNLAGVRPGKSARTFLDVPLLVLLVLWYANIPIYLGIFVLPWLTPILFTAITIILIAARQLAAGDYFQRLDPSLPIWIIGFAAMNALWFAGFGAGDSTIIGVRLMYLALMLTLYLALASSAWLLNAVRLAIFWSSCLIVLMLLYDLTHPFSFVPADSEFAYLGRAAGTYINPNQAAAALSAGSLLAIGVARERLRWLYLTWILVGVLATGSRAALLLLPLCFVFALFLGQLRFSDMRRIAIASVGVAMVAALSLPLVANRIGVDPEYITSRLSAMLQSGQGLDISLNERQYLAEKGEEKFLSRPMLGNGVGSTEYWAERGSTHNMYLQLLSDFGIAGALVLPAILLLAVPWRKNSPRSGTAVVVFYLLWGLFSHNLVTEGYLLLCVAGAFATFRAVAEDG